MEKVQFTTTDVVNEFIKNTDLIKTDINNEENPRIVMINKDRYNGIYSGNAFTAWLLDTKVLNGEQDKLHWAFGIPGAIDAGDYGCDYFWEQLNSNQELKDYFIHGGGDTPIEALRSLNEKMPSVRSGWWLGWVDLINVPSQGKYGCQVIIDIRRCHCDDDEMYIYIQDQLDRVL